MILQGLRGSELCCCKQAYLQPTCRNSDDNQHILCAILRLNRRQRVFLWLWSHDDGIEQECLLHSRNMMTSSGAVQGRVCCWSSDVHCYPITYNVREWKWMIRTAETVLAVRHSQNHLLAKSNTHDLLYASIGDKGTRR